MAAGLDDKGRESAASSDVDNLVMGDPAHSSATGRVTACGYKNRRVVPSVPDFHVPFRQNFCLAAGSTHEILGDPAA